MKTDTYTEVTNKIISDLENGVLPWNKPWASGCAPSIPLRHNGTPYRGINVLILWAAAIEHGFSAAQWMTYKQAVELGGQVRKGEKGSSIVFFATLDKSEKNSSGDEVTKHIPMLRSYSVFNVEQIDGLPAQYYPTLVTTTKTVELSDSAEAYFTSTGATIVHGGNRACYVPSADVIRMPIPESFVDGQSYQSTKAHELVHWTGHEKRTAREFGKRFGDSAYAFEELVAELGAAFLCAGLQITQTVRNDHAQYLAGWLTVLKQDKRAIFTAASAAQKAVDYLDSLQANIVAQPLAA